jgi:hypothetical protein
MTFRLLSFLGAAAAACVILPSCSITQKKGAGLAAYHSYDRPAKLPNNPNEVSVKVSLSKQRTYVMEGAEVLLSMPVSVGAPNQRTPTGDFSILNKEEKKREKNHGYAFKNGMTKQTGLRDKPAGWSFKGTPLPYWCGFKPDLGFHTGWIKHYPCTNGCIRMHENLAPKFYRLVKVGTPVHIAYSQPEDATAGNIPLPPDAGPLPDYSGTMYTGDGYFRQHKAPEYR